MTFVIVIVVVIVVVWTVLRVAASQPVAQRTMERDDVHRIIEAELDKNEDTWDHTFNSKVVGVTHKNRDGSLRQSIIKRCSRFEELRLVREPHNKHGSDAIAVCRLSGEQIGYINAAIAARLAPEIDSGTMWESFISEVTGGTAEYPTRGVNIVLLRRRAGAK